MLELIILSIIVTALLSCAAYASGYILSAHSPFKFIFSASVVVVILYFFPEFPPSGIKNIGDIAMKISSLIAMALVMIAGFIGAYAAEKACRHFISERR